MGRWFGAQRGTPSIIQSSRANERETAPALEPSVWTCTIDPISELRKSSFDELLLAVPLQCVGANSGGETIMKCLVRCFDNTVSGRIHDL